MQVRPRKHSRDQETLQHRRVVLQRFGKVPVGCKRHAFAQARAARMVHHFHDEGIAGVERGLRRLEWPDEGEADVVEVHALDLDTLLVEALRCGAVDFPNAGARQLVHRENVLRQVDFREIGAQGGIHGLDEVLRGSAGATRLRNALAFHERDGTPPPRSVGRAEHVCVGHAGHAHELVHDLRRVHVLAPRHEHVGRALLHVEAPAFEGGHVACEEVAIHRERRPGVQVARENPGPLTARRPYPSAFASTMRAR